MELPKEAYLYWIHCNRCFEIYMRKQCSIYILSCQHLACEKCVKPIEEKNAYICPICNKKGLGRQLGNSLPSHIKELFHPMPWSDGLPTTHILRFQQRHRNHFTQGMQRMSREYVRLQQSCSEARASAKEKFVTLENLRRERKRLEDRVRKVSKRRKELEEERARLNQKHPPPPPSTTDESAINSHSYHPRSRYPLTQVRRSQSAGAIDSLVANSPRMLSPIPSTSFANFAYRDNVSFAL